MVNTRRFLEELDFKIEITEKQLEDRKKSVQRLSNDYMGSVFNLSSDVYYLSELETRLKTLKEIKELAEAFNR